MGPMAQSGFPDRMIFHVDMDAFYASVEQLENPALRGKPVIVGGVDSNRGVVSSASYEARLFGVHSAMPVMQARKRCPHGIFVPGRHSLYGDYSRRLMDVFSEFSPSLEQVSVDEAFLDMTGTEGLFGDGEAAGRKLKAAIVKRLGITASVGVAENKFLAKLASDAKKPDGIVVVKHGEAQAFLDPMPVDRLWGVGKKTVLELHRVGFYTIAQLREQALETLVGYFGDNFANHLFELSRGRDDREIVTESQEKSISHERTYETDTGDMDAIAATLLDLSERVARRARREGFAGRTVTFVWRNPDFSRQSHARSLPDPTSNSQVIYEAALDLFRGIAKARPDASRSTSSPRQARKFRLIGVRLSNFSQDIQQQSLFQNPKSASNLDAAMDAVRNKFGESAIRRARLSSADEEE
ncbi:MAG: nucleotidyltransferase/DNA polymerase involved in repair [Fibrobacteres bacterium]|nr:nucleotidyltransferase/DNA polymerase involved in repair [Fibrobacterota bacterium]